MPTDTLRLVIPTDLMFAAWRRLFPAERMVIFGGRRAGRCVRLTSLSDVTERQPSAVHVRACPDRIGQALIDLERCGAHLAVWMHSHPGEGPHATNPSGIDLRQHRELGEHYVKDLVGVIAVRDGWLRVWGQAIEEGRVRIEWKGNGIEAVEGQPNVYRLSLA